MSTASGEGKDTRRPVMPFVAYTIVLVLLGCAGVAFWTEVTGGLPEVPGRDRASLAISKAAPIEPARAARGLTLPPRPPVPESTAPTKQEPAVSPSPPQSAASDSDLAASAAEKPEPRKTTCTGDVVGPWPTDRTDQAKAIQILLRDLGFYSGTTYGTVGPATRAAIGKFQLAAGDAETGEPSEMLFEQLKKKCASP
jgi:hypothetical protein